MFGGGGLSRTHIADLNANNGVLGEIEAKGLKLFVQPNVGFATKYFDVALSSRFTALHYGTATIIYSKQYLIDQDQLADNTHMFLEPAITLRGGYKFIKKFMHSLDWHSRSLRLLYHTTGRLGILDSCWILPNGTNVEIYADSGSYIGYRYSIAANQILKWLIFYLVCNSQFWPVCNALPEDQIN